MRLVLFDIDGTLIMDDGAARDAYAAALREVYDLDELTRPYDFSGLTDPQITRMVLGDAGYSEEQIARGIERLWEVYLVGLAARADRRRIRLLEGVTELLEILADDRGIILGLLTGNIEPGARIKLSPYDLNGYFPFGAFGSDHADRKELPPIACERAAQISGHRISSANVVIIGDSIFDIRCGIPHGATTVAVSSGRTSAETLAEESPDYLTATLIPDDELLAIIRGG